jgi:hypothetical protein
MGLQNLDMFKHESWGGCFMYGSWRDSVLTVDILSRHTTAPTRCVPHRKKLHMSKEWAEGTGNEEQEERKKEQENTLQ